jgi:hypothetical protein
MRKKNLFVYYKLFRKISHKNILFATGDRSAQTRKILCRFFLKNDFLKNKNCFCIHFQKLFITAII